MSTAAVTNTVTIAAAILGLAGTVFSAVWSNRKARREEHPPTAAPPPAPLPADGPAPAAVPAVTRLSRSVWWGTAGIFLCAVPALGYIAAGFGLWYGVRDLSPARGRRRAGIGLALTAAALLFCLAVQAEAASRGVYYYGTGQQ